MRTLESCQVIPLIDAPGGSWAGAFKSQHSSRCFAASIRSRSTSLICCVERASPSQRSFPESRSSLPCAFPPAGLRAGRPSILRASAVTEEAVEEATYELEKAEGTEIEEEELLLLDPDFYRMGYVRQVRAYGVEFKEGSMGVGVYSAVDIPDVTIPRKIMEIPGELMVTVSKDSPWMFQPDFLPIGHPLFEVIESTDPEKDWDLRMACMLLLARFDKENFWHLYGGFLPEAEECPSLLLATEEELEELQDPALAQQMRSEQARARDLWRANWEATVVPDKLRVLCDSEAQWMWTVAQARSRTLYMHCVFGALRQDTYVLCPYADMLNHSYVPRCFYRWRKADRMLEVFLGMNQKVRVGTHLTMAYVERQSNDELMARYGFSMPDNQWEAVEFSGRAKIHRNSFLATFSITGEPDAYTFEEGDEEKVAFLDGSVIAMARALPLWQEGELPPLPSLERQAALQLQDECRELLGRFPTTWEEDRELLELHGHPRSARWTAAIKYRMDRKAFHEKIIDALHIYQKSFIF
eukprot:TRINITY_DN20894_c0_g1_i1.p1 TRINITY_DN20894_c0_g1~~TRINITY_DN20894_c0_g1_i1.p1  ORF type:complete len:526 (-),score=90.07 TRINITY_DN20894_c0_g1_i1:295-1872(-)